MSTKNFLFLTGLVLLTLLGYYGYVSFLKKENTVSVSNSPQETNQINPNLSVKTTYNLPEGEQVYNVSHGPEVTGPRMSQIVYTPLAFKTGETQKIKIVFSEKEVVGSVVLFVTTDNKENQKVVLSKDSKINTWTGEWTPEDTVTRKYSVKIVAVGTGGEYNNTMYFL